MIVYLEHNAYMPRRAHALEAGDKIGQLVIMPIITPDLQLVASLDDFDKSERGENGFGSSGR